MQKLVYDGFQACAYLPGRVARMPLYRQLVTLDPETFDGRLAAAERRVGTSLYRTRCPTCVACEGIRVPVAAFTPSKSQRRVLARGREAIRIEVGPAEVSEDRVALFGRHKVERGLDGQGDGGPDTATYDGWLVRSCVMSVEMRYFLDGRLVGLGVVDLGERAASSAYFYFDPSPEVARLSPGTYSLLEEIALCRSTRRDWLYLGLIVDDCRHLAYKADFSPHQRLVAGQWRDG